MTTERYDQATDRPETDQDAILAAAKAAHMMDWACGTTAEAIEAQIRHPPPGPPLGDFPAMERATVALEHAEARAKAIAADRATIVPAGARIVRPAVIRWAVERRPPEDGWPMHVTLHHDDVHELSPVTVYEPLRWGPVVLVQVVEYDGVGDVWMLPAAGELVTPAGIDCLKAAREVLETIQHEAWEAEMAGERL